MAERVCLAGIPLRGDEWLTPGEAADVLEVGVPRLRQMALAGEIDCRRSPGGIRRYLASDVIALRAKRRGLKP